MGDLAGFRHQPFVANCIATAGQLPSGNRAGSFEDNFRMGRRDLAPDADTIATHHGVTSLDIRHYDPISGG
jgi:hypothetical protein